MLPAAQERALIRRVLDGQRDAAETLIKAYQGPLYSYLLRLTGRADVAEDVVQESFVRALTHLSRYDPQYRFSTWLFTIAKRLYVNSRERLAPTYDSEAMAIGVERKASRGFDPTAGATLLDDTGTGAAASLRRALGKLSEEQRDVVVLFYQLSWPVEQIGQYLDVPVGTVKSHLFRARARLRSALAEDASIVAWLAEVPA